MSQNTIITIGREFGSGGRELARRLSEELGFAYYDQEILKEIAQRTQLSESYVRAIVEKSPITSYPIHVVRSFHPAVSPVMDQTNKVCQEQTAIIKELAEKSNCIIVGRCADYILRDYNILRIFVYSGMKEKIARCRAKSGDAESLSDKELEKQIKNIDKNRKKYYDFYTGQEWGDKRNYDLMINTSNISIKVAAHEIAVMIKEFRKNID